MVFEIMEKIKVEAGLNDPDDAPIDLTVANDAPIDVLDAALPDSVPDAAPAKPKANGKSSAKSKADVAEAEL
jgi:hypothetical protein